ncbi:MAG: hypothetical protein MZV70_52700 [Desulfobacterales bacterium]|nr:hypothetical protein [Desulfobacterales bacterium]
MGAAGRDRRPSDRGRRPGRPRARGLFQQPHGLPRSPGKPGQPRRRGRSRPPRGLPAPWPPREGRAGPGSPRIGTLRRPGRRAGRGGPGRGLGPSRRTLGPGHT